jgi:hypothetical protein
MDASDKQDAQRDCSLPAGCKDLLDAIKHEGAGKPALDPLPPITRKVTLPNVVAVRFLIEISGQKPETVTGVMTQLHILVDVNRSVEFRVAQEILRHFGILAERGPYTGLTI